MEIKDLSWNESITKRFNSPLLPRSIRGITVGKSGCGKTTLLLNLLLRPGWLDYDNLCLFGRSLFQPEYRILKKAFEENLPKEYILRLFNPFLYNHDFSRVYLIRTITAFNVSTVSVQSRLFTYLLYSNNHGFSRIPFSTLKNRLFRRCLKSMIYETISVKYYLYFGVSKLICLFFGKGSYFKLKKIGVWK